MNSKGELEKMAEIIQKEIPGKYTTVKSSEKYLEIFPKDSGKGQALEELCKILEVDIKNSFAAGDQMNDYSMIKSAYNGIAMKNGSEELKKAAKFVTDEDNDHDGLVPFLMNNL